MKFRFWARLKDAQDVDLAAADEVLTRARARLNAAKDQQDESQDLKRRAERTRQINHWSAMMETAWADRPGSEQ